LGVRSGKERERRLWAVDELDGRDVPRVR